MSAAVGSIPSFTRSGRPSASFCSSAPFGRLSTASRSSQAASSAALIRWSPAGRGVRDLPRRTLASGQWNPSGPMLDSRSRRGPAVTPLPRPIHCPVTTVAGSRTEPRMSDVFIDTQAQDEQSSAPIPFAPPRRRRWRRDRSGRPPKPRVRKLRLLGILVALGALAFISLVFGMMMAVASDLPQLTNVTQQHQQVNSYLYDDAGRPIGIF